MLVLEMVPAALSADITQELKTCHTIGIGAGKGTAGQVLVMHDMLGINLGKNPKFVRNFMDGAASVRDALAAFAAAVNKGSFRDDQLPGWLSPAPRRRGATTCRAAATRRCCACARTSNTIPGHARR